MNNLNLGIIINKYKKFKLLRNNNIQKKLKFNLHSSNNLYLKTKENKIKLLDNNNYNKLELSNEIKYSKSSNYIDLFYKTNNLYNELKINLISLKDYNLTRKLNLNDEKNNEIDELINNLINLMINKIYSCEENLNIISNKNYYFNNDIEYNELNFYEKIIIDNMNINLVNKIINLIHNFRLNIENYLCNFKELNEKNSNDKNNNIEQIENNNNNEILSKKDIEINNLLNKFYELSKLFNKFECLSLKKNTIFDRIDYNINIQHEKLNNIPLNIKNNKKRLNRYFIYIKFLIFIILIEILYFIKKNFFYI